MKAILFVIAIVAMSCSTPDDKTNNANNAANNTNNSNNTSNNGNNINNLGNCDPEALANYRSELTTDCTEASDCALIPSIESCGCFGVASNEPTRADDACTEECLNNTSCTEDFTPLAPYCVQQSCVVGQAFECDGIEDGTAYDPLRFCQSDEECGIRPELSPCGCPLVVSIALVDSQPETGQGGISYELLTPTASLRALIDGDACDFSYCQLVDCVQETETYCGADGRCALGPRPG